MSGDVLNQFPNQIQFWKHQVLGFQKCNTSIFNQHKNIEKNRFKVVSFVSETCFIVDTKSILIKRNLITKIFLNSFLFLVEIYLFTSPPRYAAHQLVLVKYNLER
jgi:hypothetical protein